jgi:hypothetical protein
MSKTFIIYKIRPLDKTLDFSYIGSTICFPKRKFKHKGVCCNEKSKSHDIPLYKSIRENGGWDAFEMVPLEEYKCDTKLQARIREQDTLDKIENKLNSIRAYSDDTTTKEQKKLYRDENKERIQELTHQHYLINRDVILEKRNGYRNKKKTAINEQKKEKVECCCGAIVSKSHLGRHRDTIKHQMFVEASNDTNIQLFASNP